MLHSGYTQWTISALVLLACLKKVKTLQIRELNEGSCKQGSYPFQIWNSRTFQDLFQDLDVFHDPLNVAFCLQERWNTYISCRSSLWPINFLFLQFSFTEQQMLNLFYTMNFSFHDFPWQMLSFHDFPVLDYEILKFYDFPGFQSPIRSLCKP